MECGEIEQKKKKKDKKLMNIDNSVVTARRMRGRGGGRGGKNSFQ